MWKRSLAVTIALAAVLTGWPQPARGAVASYGELMSALKNAPSEATKFRAMMGDLNASEFHLVNISGLMAGGNRTAYQSAVKKDQSDIADLRETLAHTTLTGTDGLVILLSTMLKQSSLTVNQVVAVHVDAGDVTLFYQ
ncbi:MAG TPA: hypothetical protein VIG51_12255 [Candidatus Baltobacteraceae bacterium]|jgi:hypothetical protein